MSMIMLIRSVKLENIRSYINEKIEFPEGSVLLSGDIGSGKSTILLAIEFALFGIRKKHLTGSSLLRNGENNGSVELDMEIEGKDIVIKRVLKRGKDRIKQESGYIIIDGMKKAATAVELKSRIIELMGYPKELAGQTKNLVYSYTVYTPQEEMKTIIEEDEELRVDTLRKVFGIEKYNRIKKNSLILGKEFRKKRSIYETRTENLEKLKQEKQEKKKEMMQSEEMLKKAEAELKESGKELNEKKKLVEELEEKKRKLDEINKAVEMEDMKSGEKVRQAQEAGEKKQADEKNIKELEEKLSRLNMGKPVEMDERELEKEIREEEEKEKKLISQRSFLKERINSISEQLKNIDKEISGQEDMLKELSLKKQEHGKFHQEAAGKKDIKEKMEASEKKMREAREERQVLEARKKDSENNIKGMIKLDNCPTCHQEVPDSHKSSIIKQEEDKKAKFDAAVDNLRKKENTLSKESEELKAKIHEIEEKEKKMQGLRLEIENLQEKIKAAKEKQEQKAKLSAELENYEKKLSEMKDINNKKLEEKKGLMRKLQLYLNEQKERKYIFNMIEEKKKNMQELELQKNRLKKEIGDISTRKRELQQKKENISFSEERYAALKKEIDEKAEQEKKISTRKAYHERDIKNIKENIERIDEDISRMQEEKKKLGRTKEMHSWLTGHFLKLMGNIENHVFLNIYNEFNSLFEQWFNVLIDEETMNAKMNKSFTPIVEQNGYDVEVSNLSGGERTAAALAYRLALNKVVNDLMSEIKTKDLIILDEPTDGFSSEQLDRVRDVLEEIGVKQVIVVSHENKIESFVDNVIRINKNEHVSEVVS
ncbi:AAA family ATPase [Candidatus Woesearchaeota archaeon]|nr:AAA family ATPase [Candidatus Woesearchaeota archaeon]